MIPSAHMWDWYVRELQIAAALEVSGQTPFLTIMTDSLLNTNIDLESQSTPPIVILVWIFTFISFCVLCLLGVVGLEGLLHTVMMQDQPWRSELCLPNITLHSHVRFNQEISTHKHSIDQNTIPILHKGLRLTFWLWGAYIVAKLGSWSPSWVAFALSPVMAPGELPDSPGPWTNNRGCMCARTTLHAKRSTLKYLFWSRFYKISVVDN